MISECSDEDRKGGVLVDLNLAGKIALVLAVSQGLGKAIATELVKEGTNVMLASWDEENLQKVQKELIIIEAQEAIPLGRYGTPEEFAKFVTFFVSDVNTYVTGASLIIDGGSIKAI